MIINNILENNRCEIRSRKLLKNITLLIIDAVCTIFYAIILQNLIACNLQAELKKCRFRSAGFSSYTLSKQGLSEFSMEKRLTYQESRRLKGRSGVYKEK